MPLDLNEMDNVERLKEGAETILSGAGTLETLEQMQERVRQIAAGNSVPWHLSEKQVNLELFEVMRKVWNFSLGLEKTTKKSERGEYLGRLRYFCVGIVLYLVVERGVNETPEGEREEPLLEVEEDVVSENKLKTLSMSQLLKMALNSGKVCLDYVPDVEMAQSCFQIFNEHYGAVRRVEILSGDSAFPPWLVPQTIPFFPHPSDSRSKQG